MADFSKELFSDSQKFTMDDALALEGVSGKAANVIKSIFQQETNSGKNAKTSNRGAVGNMQILPATFSSVADKGWDIANPEHNLRAGVRYAMQGFNQSDGDPALTGAFYYGGPNGLSKAKQGIAVSDPVNPNAPTTLQYGAQVAARVPKEQPKGRDLSVELFGELPKAPVKDWESSNGALPQLNAPQQKPLTASDIIRGEALRAQNVDQNQNAYNMIGGGLRGVGGLGSGVMRLLPNAIGGDTAEENQARRLAMDNALKNLGVDTESNAFGVGKLGAEIAGTGGIGGMLAKLPFLATYLPKVASGLNSAGFTTGRSAAELAATAAKPILPRVGAAVGDMGTRVLTGGTVGALGAAAVNPDDAMMGAAVGGLLPPAAKGAMLFGKGAGAAASGAFNAMTPELKKYAVKLAESTGQSVESVAQSLNQSGPQLIQGSEKTVPQILQDKTISQIARTLKNKGFYGVDDVESANQLARLGALERVSPTMGTVNDARANVGNALESFAKPAYLQEGKSVTRKFDSIDPFGETRIELPIDAMKAARDKYMGIGTYGAGEKANAAISKAEEIGLDIIPAIKPLPVKGNQAQTLEQAVRSAGGIKQSGYLSDELKDLGRKQSSTTGLLSQKGLSPEAMAIKMRARGFIDSEDPAQLLDMLRNGGGRKVYAGDANTGEFQRRAEAAMGDMPGKQVIQKPVPFDQIQNLRSSLGEQWKIASKEGATKESASLKAMIDAIDDKVKSVADGGGNAGEYFPPDVVATWREALKAHQDKKIRFNTGPQAAMFRRGSDGLPAKEGAEIAPLFWNSGNAQIENVKAFKALTKEDQGLVRLMKSNATTEALQQGARGPEGLLTFDKFNKWLQSHSGAAKELFSPEELAALNGINNELRAAASADALGMAKSSNTAQNIFSQGMLDNPKAQAIASSIPFGVGKYVTGPMLNYVKSVGEQKTGNALQQLLANKELMAESLKGYKPRSTGGQQFLNTLEGQNILKLINRSAPVLSAQ